MNIGKPAMRERTIRGWNFRFHPRPLMSLLLLLLTVQSGLAHIGSPNVIFEGEAGPYPVRVIIRPPEVIPGLAEIHVRVISGRPETVTVLPVRFDVGKAGAPTPDPAAPVRGETNLFGAELWFMRDGAHSVEVALSGPEGEGTVQVPVNPMATRTLTLSTPLRFILAPLGLVLFFLAVSIVGGAVRHSVLPPGESPSFSRRLWAASGMITAALVVGSLIWLGKLWWDAEEADYRGNRLYQPYAMDAAVEMDAGFPSLRLTVTDERFRRGAPLVPDHGKLMHLFVISIEESGAFAHLHPARTQWDVFEVALPELPPGSYRLYADVTHETGFSHTLTNMIVLPEQERSGHAVRSRLQPDADDSWWVEAEQTPALARDATEFVRIRELNSELRMQWHPSGPIVTDQETELHFSILDAAGSRVGLEPYMGMLAHVVVANREGTVFTHLHPSGSISMASQQLFELRADGDEPVKIAFGESEPFCRLPGVEDSAALWGEIYAPRGDYSFSIPYAFPRAGTYQMWVQVKVNGKVLTARFDADVGT